MVFILTTKKTPSDIKVLLKWSITYVMDNVADDLTLYWPADAAWEVDQFWWWPETYNRSSTTDGNE